MPACRKVHFCSSTYKDAVQLRNRFKRIAKNTAREFDEVTDDGTLVYGVIEGGDQELAEKTLQGMEIPSEFFEIKDGKIEVAWWVLEEFKENIREELEPSGSKLLIIERYPFEDGLLVELIPL